MNINISQKVKSLNNMLCNIDNAYQMLLQSKNLSDSDYAILFAILELGEGCLQKDISSASYISKKTINTTIKKFERDGLIELRAGKYPNMHIYFTQNGQKYIEENIIPLIDFENKFMEDIPDKEFEHMAELYLKYIKIFKQKVEEAKI
jgi:DNA-binding MarR family transcriptional regulator